MRRQRHFSPVALDLPSTWSEVYDSLASKGLTTSGKSTDRGPTEERPRFVATLTVMHHPVEALIGQSRPIGSSPTELGRESTFWAEGTFDHRQVSRRHVRVVSEGYALRVEDLASRNGTFLNGTRVNVAHAQPGDVIELGPVLVLYHLAPAAAGRLRSTRLLGQSAAIVRVLEDIERIAAHGTTTLVLGETGTGKELVAREIHERSGRSGPFVPANCGSLTDNLLQGELFGYERGAFSGAVNSHKGYVEAAHGGTMLLDEIGDGSASLQTSLLRVLQEREIRRLGSTKAIPVDVRFVAATHRDIASLVRLGGFREDLYARLSQWVIQIPPLRERREDIPVLSRAVLHRLGERRPFASKTMLALLRADFPRNVRQLEAAVERIVRSAHPHDPELRLPTDLVAMLSETVVSRQEVSTAPSPPPLSAVSNVGHQAAVHQVKNNPERLTELLARHGGNVTHLARELGVGRNTVYRWIKENQVSLSSVRDDDGPGEER